MRRRIEIPTTGFDEALQLAGSDPFGGSSWVGLRVPFLPTITVAGGNPGDPRLFANRYLFAACLFSVGEGTKATILGYRQMVTIGQELSVGESSNVRVIEQLVTSPFWHFADVGGPSFHLRSWGAPNGHGLPQNKPAPGNLRSFALEWSDQPALLYQTATVPDAFYVDLTAYKPPNGGRPWGEPLSDGHQGTFYDQRTPWRTADAWTSLDVVVEGPKTVGMFISVAQTDPQNALRPIPGTINPTVTMPLGLSEEEQFLVNFPNAQYWRVGASLIVEIE